MDSSLGFNLEQYKAKKANFEQQFSKYKKTYVFILIKELLFIALALIPYAWCVNSILIPHTIVSGALTGVCEILYFASNSAIPVWLSTLVLNAILLIIACLSVGWKFCAKTIYGVACLTLWLKVIPITEIPVISDPFMATVIAGMLDGIGIGLVFLNNGSSGGTDIIAMIVNKYKQMPIGKVLFLCDLIIISSAWFLPQITKIEQIFLGLCYTLVASTSVDVVMNKVRRSVQFFIFSKKYREIADAIIYKVPRGVTILNGEGGYTKDEMKVVTVLAKEVESKHIFDLVKAIDPNAFISESRVKGVFGNGFDKNYQK